MAGAKQGAKKSSKRLQEHVVKLPIHQSNLPYPIFTKISKNQTSKPLTDFGAPFALASWNASYQSAHSTILASGIFGLELKKWLCVDKMLSQAMQLNQLNFFPRTERSQISEEDPSLIPALFRLWSKSNVRDRKIVSQEKTSPGWMDPSFSTAPWEGLTCLGRTNTNVWRSSAASRDGFVSSKCLYREDYKSDNSHLCFRLLSPSGTSISEVCTATASKVALHSLQWNFTHWQVKSLAAVRRAS